MYNPYIYNPYQQQRVEIVKVNGEGGARAYNLPANSSILLLDETQPLIWVKQTDGAGYPTITAYDIQPHIEKAAPDVASLEQRIEKLERLMNESNIDSTKYIQSDRAAKTATKQSEFTTAIQSADAV
jgi:hypothetical protein